MKNTFIVILCLVAVVACKQDNATTNETTTQEQYTAKHSSKIIEDDIQVNTIQIGGETNEDKNNFQASYPQTKYDFINSIEQQQAQEFQAEFEKEAKNVSPEAFAGLTFGKHFEVLEKSDRIIGFLHETYRSFGNNFSDDYSTSYYDLAEKKQITPKDFFKSEKDFQAFAKKAYEATNAKLKTDIEEDSELTADDKKALFESLEEQIKTGTEAKYENYSTVVFRPETVDVIFNKYQVAPGNWGSVKVQLKSKDVSEYIKDEYQTLFQLEKKAVETKKVEQPAKKPAPKKEEQPTATTTPSTTKGAETSSVDCSQVPCVPLTYDDGRRFTPTDY